MKQIFFTIILGLVVITLQAQIGFSESSAIKNSKWTYGGYAGLSGFGSGGMTIYASPHIGYKLSNNVIAGLEGTLSWHNRSQSSSTILGVGPFIQYYFQRSFYATVNFREYFIRRKYKATNSKDSFNESALNIGAGYLQTLGSNVYLQIGATYNVLYDKEKSIFSSPFVPYMGIVVGL